MAAEKPKMFRPFTTSLSDRPYLDFRYMDGASNYTYVATLTAGTTYYDPATWAAGVQTALHAAARVGGGGLTFADDWASVKFGVAFTPYTPWVANTAYAVGDIVRPTSSSSAAGASDWFICTTAGTSHASTEPTWPTSSTVADGTVTWTWRGTQTSSTGRCTIAITANTFNFLNLTGTNQATSHRYYLGFPATDQTGAAYYTGTRQHNYGWYAEDPPVDDTGNIAEYIRSGSVALSGKGKTLHFSKRYIRTVELAFLPAYKVFLTEEESGTYLFESIENFFQDGYGRFRYWPDQTVAGTYDDYYLHEDTYKAFQRKRLSPGLARYSISMKMRKRVA